MARKWSALDEATLEHHVLIETPWPRIGIILNRDMYSCRQKAARMGIYNFPHKHTNRALQAENKRWLEMRMAEARAWRIRNQGVF